MLVFVHVCPRFVVSQENPFKFQLLGKKKTMDPSIFLGRVWGMIWGAKYLLRQWPWIHRDIYVYLSPGVKANQLYL